MKPADFNSGNLDHDQLSGIRDIKGSYGWSVIRAILEERCESLQERAYALRAQNVAGEISPSKFTSAMCGIDAAISELNYVMNLPELTLESYPENKNG